MADFYKVYRTKLTNIIGIRPIMNVEEAQEALKDMRKSGINVYDIGPNGECEKLSEDELDKIIVNEIEKQRIEERL